jgi:hypothetical protein
VFSFESSNVSKNLQLCKTKIDTVITHHQWKGALEGCCAIGMKLLSVDYDHEYSNLLSAINGDLRNAAMSIADLCVSECRETGLSKYDNKSTDPGDFWTSGTDSGCDSAHGWCAVNKLFRQAKWAPGQPDNKVGGIENCVSVEITKSSALLHDQNCAKKLRYVCEVIFLLLDENCRFISCRGHFQSRDTTNTSSNSEAMLDECGAAYNVSRGDFLTFYEPFMNISLQRKPRLFLT